MHASSQNREFEYIVVGSGAGGACLAETLARSGRSVLVVERGQAEVGLGTSRASLRFYDLHRVTQRPLTSREGVILWRTLMAGGSTEVACGNAVRCLQTELAARGIALESEFLAMEKAMGVAPFPEERMSSASEQLQRAANRMGIRFVPMPKCLDFQRCRRCGQCVLGCAAGAKWTARRALDAASAAGAIVHCGVSAHEVLIEHGRVAGVRCKGPEGRVDWRARTVVLACGALETPRLLQRAGLGAGEGLFADLFVNVCGVRPTAHAAREPPMALVNLDFHSSQGFLLSPYVSYARLARLIELGVAGAALPTDRLLGVMVKIADEASGRVPVHGPISKPITDRDAARLRAGTEVARELLVHAGVDPASIVTSRVQGAHPGGTAAIGDVVDANLRTSMPGLYVCDASVLPTAPGLPPILTLAALARRLGAHLAEAS